MSKPTLTVTADFTKDFMETVKKFKKDTVLVGIPEAESPRDTEKVDGKTPIGNAALLAINNFGSPAQNIPARPVMEIGIRNAQEEIAAQFKLAVRAAFKSGFSAVSSYYQRIGLIGANSVKKAINSQEGIAEPAESTLRSRESKGFKGTKALIVTGQMRNSITYVVKEGA